MFNEFCFVLTFEFDVVNNCQNIGTAECFSLNFITFFTLSIIVGRVEALIEFFIFAENNLGFSTVWGLCYHL